MEKALIWGILKQKICICQNSPDDEIILQSGLAKLSSPGWQANYE